MRVVEPLEPVRHAVAERLQVLHHDDVADAVDAREQAVPERQLLAAGERDLLQLRHDVAVGDHLVRECQIGPKQLTALQIVYLPFHNQMTLVTTCNTDGVYRHKGNKTENETREVKSVDEILFFLISVARTDKSINDIKII